MARFKCTGIGLYVDQLQKLGNRTVGVMKMGTYDGAAIIADEVKKGLQSAIRHQDESTGDLEKSMYLAHMVDENGYIYTEIGFAGYDSKGVPNILKARALESGTSKQKKSPFVRKAFNSARDRCMAAMQKTVDEEIQKIMEE